jgi:hypothetical protein
MYSVVVGSESPILSSVQFLAKDGARSSGRPKPDHICVRGPAGPPLGKSLATRPAMVGTLDTGSLWRELVHISGRTTYRRAGMARIRAAAPAGEIWPPLGSLLLGILWAGWHLPLFLIHFVNVAVWAFTIILITVSVFLTLGSNLSGFSVVVPILIHAAFNTSSRLLAALCRAVATRQPDLPFYLVAVTAAASAAVLLTRGRLGSSRLRQR